MAKREDLRMLRGLLDGGSAVDSRLLCDRDCMRLGSMLGW